MEGASRRARRHWWRPRKSNLTCSNGSSALHFQLSGEIPKLLEKRSCTLRRPWHASNVPALRTSSSIGQNPPDQNPCLPDGSEFASAVKGDSRLQRKWQSQSSPREKCHETHTGNEALLGGRPHCFCWILSRILHDVFSCGEAERLRKIKTYRCTSRIDASEAPARGSSYGPIRSAGDLKSKLKHVSHRRRKLAHLRFTLLSSSW